MDGNQRTVILFGNSLILQGVRANLAGRPALEVVVIDQPLLTLSEELAARHPAAVIFDMSVIEPQPLLALLKQPGLLLVGMDVETHQALVWSGRQAAAVDAADLFRVLAVAKGGQDCNFSGGI